MLHIEDNLDDMEQVKTRNVLSDKSVVDNVKYYIGQYFCNIDMTDSMFAFLPPVIVLMVVNGHFRILFL